MIGSPWRRAAGRWCLYVAAFALTAGFRFLSLDNGFPNDHFVYISGGWQTLMGEWPTRDWVDQGLPLMFTASAVAQGLLGTTLFAEAVLVSVAFGLAAAFTLGVVLESTGSVWLALLATVLEVAVLPRTYGYPKILVYPIAFLCFYRYAMRPGAGRLLAMAGAIAVAFLFRHDHGLFLGIGGMLTVLLVPGARGMRANARPALMLASATLVMLLPYLLYVQAYAGLIDYFRVGLAVSGREAARQWHIWPSVFGDDAPLLSAMLYELHAIPLIALAVLASMRRQPRFRQIAAFIVPVAVVAIAVNVSFLRVPLLTRLADGIAPAVILGAWIVKNGWESRLRWVAVPVSALAIALFSASVLEVGSTAEALDRIGPARRWFHPAELFQERTGQLQTRFFEQQLPTRATLSLIPFFSYVDRCTTAEHRLLVGGFLVEVPFFAQRKFAAGMGYFGGSFGSEVDDKALERLRDQVVPLAVIPGEELEGFTNLFPHVAAYVDSTYAPLASIKVGEDDDDEVRVMVNRELAARAGRDPQTGWPCWVAR